MAVSRPQRTKPAETFERTLDAMERAGFVVGMRPGVGQFSYLATKLDDFGYGQRIAITFSHAAEPKPEERPDPRFENWLVVDEALPDHEREALTTNKRPFLGKAVAGDGTGRLPGARSVRQLHVQTGGELGIS